MNNTEKKKVSWIKILRPIALALVLLFLLSYATYAWMKRDWTPKIYQDNVKIVAGSSLTFIFDDKEIDEVPINTLLNMSNFEFKSVSNATGRSDNFFGLNYSPSGEYYNTFNHLDKDEDINPEYATLYSNEYTALGRSNGYIELQFRIASATGGEVKDKEIYLHPDSGINGTNGSALNETAAKAIRVSITVHGETEDKDVTYVISNNTKSHKGITPHWMDGYKYTANGAPQYVSVEKQDGTIEMKRATEISKAYLPEGSIPLTETLQISTFDELNAKALFVLEKDTQRTITVRIWLEGEDENCTDSIAGSAIDLLLKFAARDASVQS